MLSKHLLHPPAVPSLYNGSAWVSIVVDDLFKLEAPVPGGFLKVPGMNGWMMKLNALVTCPAREPNQPALEGYQIITLDFEATRGPSGWIKQQGALSTQKVPSCLSLFEVSSGPSGATTESSMAPGTSYSAAVKSVGREAVDGVDSEAQGLLLLRGTLAALESEDEQSFCDFVVNRPHKFLLQQQPQRGKSLEAQSQEGQSRQQQLVFASWRSSDCSSTGCMRVVPGPRAIKGGVSKDLLLPILRRRLSAELIAHMHLDEAFCFLQPEYSMIDCKNTLVDW
jgi:hypothetical protein